MYAVLRRWRGRVLYWNCEVPGWHYSPSEASLYYSRSVALSLAFVCLGTEVVEVFVEEEAVN